MAESYISVGKLGKPHGIRGAFRFLLYRELRNKKKLPAHFILLQKGTYLPFFIKETEWNAFNAGFISFEEIDTPEKAKQFGGNDFFLEEKMLEKFFKKSAGDFDFMLGWIATNEIGETIGVIESIEENPGQVLAVVNIGGKKVFIPLVDDFILKTDKRKKQISFSLPDGLLDL